MRGATRCLRPVIDCEPRAANERHYILYFYIYSVPERAIEEKRFPTTTPLPPPPSAARHFLIPESWKLFFFFFGLHSSAAPSTFRVLFLFIRGISTQQNNQLRSLGRLVLLAEILLAGLSVGRFSRSFRLFALRCWIHPASPVPPRPSAHHHHHPCDPPQLDSDD